MPSSSSVRTSVASVKRAGGLVSCPCGSSARSSTVSPSEKFGNRRSSSPSCTARSSSRPSSYAARKPRNVITVPDAPNSAVSFAFESPAIRSETVCPCASYICEAIVRIQISS